MLIKSTNNNHWHSIHTIITSLDFNFPITIKSPPRGHILLFPFNFFYCSFHIVAKHILLNSVLLITINPTAKHGQKIGQIPSSHAWRLHYTTENFQPMRFLQKIQISNAASPPNSHLQICISLCIVHLDESRFVLWNKKSTMGSAPLS